MWLYDNNHKKIEFLPYYKDRNIVSVLSTGDKTLNFSYPIEKSENIVEENYIRTETDEYVIKQTKTNGKYLEVIATLNVEDLEGVTFNDFKTTYATITETLNLMLKDTGWKVGYCEVTKKRTIAGQYKNAWNLSQLCIDTYLCELEYDTINKLINVYEKRGSYKGVFIIDGINMKDLEIQSSSYDFYTRLIPIGKDGVTIADVNGGKVYLENYQYSKKVKTTYWKDERYTIPSSLYEDALVKLDEISQPVISYSMTIKDLAKMNKKYKAYEFNLGDTVLLVSKAKNVRLKHRIVKYTEYPENPENNKIEVSTTKITLETIQKKFNDTTTTVNNITNADGTISTGSIAGLNEMAEELDKKVDKVNGKGLSSNDFTDELKRKLETVESNGEENVIESISINGVQQPVKDKNVNIVVDGGALSILDVYPIGSIYMSVNNINPSTLFGGKWESWGAGKVPVGVDTSQTEFDSVEKTGGAKNVTLSVEQMPRHTHIQNEHNHNINEVNGDNNIVASGGYNNSGNEWDANFIYGGQPSSWGFTNVSSFNTRNTTAINQETGGSEAHNNLQPYITCYMWKRTE